MGQRNKGVLPTLLTSGLAPEPRWACAEGFSLLLRCLGSEAQTEVRPHCRGAWKTLIKGLHVGVCLDDKTYLVRKKYIRTRLVRGPAKRNIQVWH